MDDGGPDASILIFLGLLLAEAYFYGFGAALNGLNEKETERKAEEKGDKTSILLTRIIGSPSIYINTVQLILTFINLCMGGLYLRAFGGWMEALFFRIADRIGGVPLWVQTFFTVSAAVLTVLLLLYVLLVFGVMIPRKIVSRQPDRWAARLACERGDCAASACDLAFSCHGEADSASPGAEAGRGQPGCDGGRDYIHGE